MPSHVRALKSRALFSELLSLHSTLYTMLRNYFFGYIDVPFNLDSRMPTASALIGHAVLHKQCYHSS
jgi:hypothetical protein